MAFRRRSSSSDIDVTNYRRLDANSTWQRVQNMWRRTGSSWITVYTYYTAINVFAPDAVAIAGPPNLYVTKSSTAQVTGGSGTITYQWTRVSGINCLYSGATSKTAVFRSTQQGTVNAQYRVTATDGITTSSYVIDVNLTLGDPL